MNSLNADGMALACALQAGLIKRDKNGYDKNQVRLFLWTLRASRSCGATLNREQMELLKAYKHWTCEPDEPEPYHSSTAGEASEAPAEYRSKQREKRDDERGTSYVAVAAAFASFVLFALSILFKLI